MYDRPNLDSLLELSRRCIRYQFDGAGIFSGGPISVTAREVRRVKTHRQVEKLIARREIGDEKRDKR
jgi:hypothetical protein